MADTAAIIRDILLSVYLTTGILLTLILLVIAWLLYRAVRSLLRSVTHVTDNIGEVSDLAMDNITSPLREGSSFSSALGSAAGFVSGFISGLRGGRERGRERDEEDRERNRDRDRRRRRRRRR